MASETDVKKLITSITFFTFLFGGLSMSLIMQDFAYRYNNNPIEDLLFYNQERQILSDRTIEYNELKIKQSKIFKKLYKNNSKIQNIQNTLDELSNKIWGKHAN